MRPSNYIDADHTKGTAINHWFMAAGFTGATIFVSSYLPWPWVFEIDSPDFNPMIVLPLMLIGVSGYQLFHAVRWTARLVRFGSATMELKGAGTVWLGRQLQGVIRTARPIQPEGPYRFVLQCIDTHEFLDHSDAATRTHRAESFTVWKHELEVPATGVDSTRGIPFSFQLPASVGPGPAASRVPTGSPHFQSTTAIVIPGMRRVWSHNDPPQARTWQLDVSAPMPGTDFHAQFIVPVQQG